jgi:hypothetical protein
MLKRGEITREQAIEIMDQRAREEAMRSLFSPTKVLRPDSAASTGNPRNAAGTTER